MERTLFALVLLLVGLASAPARATVYEWVDDKGVVNLTDDPEKIPVRYRKKVKMQDVETQGEALPQVQEKQAAPDEPVVPAGPRLIDGHDMAWWRGQYSRLRDEQRKISEELPGKRDKLPELRRKRVIYQRSRDRVAYNAMNDEIQQDETRLKELQSSLDQLDADASRLGVPQDWR